MDYEKEYKEALERARDVYTYYCDDREQLRKIEFIFPVLKESKWERIKREIIEYIKTGTYRNDWVAWLEKQGQVKDSANFQHENKMCKENGDSLTNEDEMVRKELLAVVDDLVLPDDQQSRFVTWLEKQGEQKPQGKPALEVWKDMRLEVYQQASGNRHEPNYSDDSTKMFSLTDIDEIFEKVAEKQGKISPILSNSSNIVKNWKEEDEKRVENILSVLKVQVCWDGATLKKMNPYQKEIDWVKSLSLQGRSALEAANEPADNANKVVARFKAGDWIVSTSNVYKIISLNDELNCYIAVTPKNKEVEIPYYFDDEQGHMRSYHLWTINDARDGDVLALNNEVFIYAHRKQTYSIAVAHCFVDSAGGFYLDGEFGYRERGETIFPATKEQCDTLWSAMREAGYKWNFEIKKAIKI